MKPKQVKLDEIEDAFLEVTIPEIDIDDPIPPRRDFDDKQKDGNQDQEQEQQEQQSPPDEKEKGDSKDQQKEENPSQNGEKGSGTGADSIKSQNGSGEGGDSNKSEQESEGGIEHPLMEKVVSALKCDLHVMLVGPAGSGKSTMAKNIAKKMGLNFHFTGALTSEYKLLGFMDAYGRLVKTPFRKAYEEGGVFLFDEMDASSPSALLAFNAALSIDEMDFPDACIKKHPDFKCIAACNTFGTGPTREYVGRNSLDAASLDRFVVIHMGYDKLLESSFTKNELWLQYVQNVRKEVDDLKLRHVVSPRATIFGSKLLETGMSPQDVCQYVLWKGLAQDQVKKIIQRTGEFTNAPKTELQFIKKEVEGATIEAVTEANIVEIQKIFISTNLGMVQGLAGNRNSLTQAFVSFIQKSGRGKAALPQQRVFNSLTWGSKYSDKYQQYYFALTNPFTGETEEYFPNGTVGK